MGSPAVVTVPSRKSPSSGRRTNKPLVEKKRRARINGCLGQLKSLILSAMQTEQGAQVSRLEKADILEMTVKYLRHVQRQQVSNATMATEPEVVAKFSAGYTECATEVIRYMDQAKCVTSDVKTRLESHLVERLRDTVCMPGSGSSPSSVQGNLNTSPQRHIVPANGSAIQAVSNASMPSTIQTSNSGVVSTPGPTITNNCAKSTMSTASDEYARHYQTAVDLANMAAGVMIPCHTSSSASCSAASEVTSSPPSGTATTTRLHTNDNIVRSKSISPAHNLQEREALRKRYNSSEPIVTQPAYASSSSSSSHRNATTISTTTIHTNNDSYLCSIQKPLHIEIPQSPDPVIFPSANFAQRPNICARNAGQNLISSKSTYTRSASTNTRNALTSSPSPVASSLSSSSATTIYDYQEDAPPTLLYAYNYNLQNRPNKKQGQAITNSPKMDYSLVVYSQDSLVVNSTAATAVSTHGEKFHASNAPTKQLNDATNFYCAPQVNPSRSQGQLERPMQHPTTMNSTTTLSPHSCQPQGLEFDGERRDLNNNNYYLNSHTFHCPTFATGAPSQTGEHSLRKDGACPQIPSDFYCHNKINPCNNSINLAPAAMSSNLTTRFQGDSQTRNSGPAPHPPAQRSSSPSSPLRDNSDPSPPALLLSSNNDTHQAFHSVNRQRVAQQAPLPPHSRPVSDASNQSSAPTSYYPHHSLSSPCSNDTPFPESTRPALKKHLLFGQRSEVTRRQCNLSPYTSVDGSRPGSADTDQTIMASVPVRGPSRQSCCDNGSRHALAGEQRETAGRRGDSYGLSCMSTAYVSSAKRPCLDSVTAQRAPLTSCNRIGHSAEDTLWRPW
ncbi:hypothetical protein PoB_003493700 [Plakobranchus ocellatus]|uniref:Uncharacterized protein n=1 Tax=Plakobranchus ocellatus TaxID=259542 RepID=A0AAV4ANC5_9GAST|nr:hypothetical protein PoB_003493700 [Plakobranchus ocellatus]